MLLHEKLHQLTNELIDAKTILKASDSLITESFKKHISLIEKTSAKVDSIQKQIDETIQRSLV